MAKIQNGEEILPKVLTPRVGHTNVTSVFYAREFRLSLSLYSYRYTFWMHYSLSIEDGL